jgi:hypothetical protein
MSRALLFLCALALPAAASAKPLTIRAGESWAFSLKGGDPVRAHKVKATDKPARGEIKATVTSLGGTSMTLTNNSATAYTFRAQLVGVTAKRAERTCTLPANMQPTLEYWPQKAKAVRIGEFRSSKDAGNCPPGQ